MLTGKSATDRDLLALSVALSLIVHAVLIVAIGRNRPGPLPEPPVFSVSVEPPAPEASQRTDQPKTMVSRSDAPAEKPPPDTKQLSETDSRAEKEQIKRGDDGGPVGPQQRRTSEPPAKAQKVTQAQKPAPQRSAEQREAVQKPSRAAQTEQQSAPVKGAEKKPSGNIRDLLLDPQTVTDKFALKLGEQKPQPVTGSSRPLSSYAAFSRPSGSGASFMGSGGVADYLPNLPDGDITLLNAKANQYAGFVRRVAVQVFAQLRSQGWENLSFNEVREISDFTTIVAVLSDKGTLIRTELLDGSGSRAFDGVLDQAVKAGARDSNPPPGARAADGTIRFVFKAKSWAEVGSDGRTGAPRQRRWLLLATGLE